jgi:hypothetical protein
VFEGARDFRGKRSSWAGRQYLAEEAGMDRHSEPRTVVQGTARAAVMIAAGIRAGHDRTGGHRETIAACNARADLQGGDQKDRHG